MNFERLKLKIRYFLVFYKSTLMVCLTFSLVMGVIAYLVQGLQKSINVFLYCYTFWGLLLDALGRVYLRRSEFFFYNNGSWPIWGLYVLSFVFSLLISLIIYLLQSELWDFC